MATSKKRYVQVKFTNTKDEVIEVRPDYSYSYCTTRSSGGQGKLYTYTDDLEEPLKEFDTVIVPTRYGHALAVVQTVGNKKPTNVTGEIKSVGEKIVSKVLEDELNAERAKALKKNIEKKLKEVDEMERFKQAAKNNPELQAMVDELAALTATEGK